MRKVFRIFGIPILSIESDEVAEEAELTAADNGGETGSLRIDVPLGFTTPEWDQGWTEERKR